MEVLGAVLATASILPVAMQRIDTCVVTSLGLGALCLCGVALATDTGHATRWWLLGGGVVLTALGIYLQRRHKDAPR